MWLKSKLTLVLSVCMTSLFSQTFNWNAYPANSTNWVPVANFSVTTSTSGGGAFDRRSSSTAANSPISGTGGATAQNCGTYAGLRLEMSGAGNSSGTGVWNNSITVTINFPTFLCAPVTFSIYDITETFYNDGSFNYVNYQDKVTISALDNNNNPVTPGATVAGGIDNNVVGTSRVLIANGTGAQCTNQNITVGTSGQQIKQITIVYSNQDLPTHCPAPVGSPPRYGISQYQYVFISPITGTAPPTAAISSPTLPCGVTATTFTASTSASSPTYSWSGPGGSVITSPTASVTAVSGAGVYTLTINPGGCSSTATFAIGSGGTPPSVTASTSNTITCTTTTAQAIASTASSPVSYTWTGPGIVSGASTATAIVNAGGTYNYTVTNTSTGCSTTGTLAVAQNTSVVTATANATASLSCNTSTAQVVLTTTTTPAGYSWSGPGIVSGSSTASITVNAGGTYNYTVTNTDNGCRTTGSVPVTQNTTQPTVTASSTSLTCNTTTAQAASSTAVSPANYSWTGPGIVSGALTGTVIVNAGGTYNYTVTNPANGCSRTGTVAVTQNTATPQVSVSVTSTLTCNTQSVQVIATTTTSPASYTWSGPGIVSGASTASITVNAGGSYEYTVTNTSNGCSTSGLMDVIQNTVVVTASATATSTISCTSATAQAVISTSTTPASYVWSGPGVVSGGTTATVTVNAGGTYNYTVTNTDNGCFTTGTVAVQQSTTSINASASAGSAITCSTASVQATISTTATPVTYTWSGPGIVSGASTATAVVNAGGTYNYTVTNTNNGCSTTGTLVVSQNTTAPTASLTANSVTTTCSSPTVTLNANSDADPNATYAWTTPSTGSLDNTGISSPTASGSGVFTVVVTNTVNGCVSAQQTVTVTADANIPVLTASATSTIVCSGTAITLSVSGTDTYTWSANASSANTATVSVNPTVTTTYSVAGTNSVSGCSGITNITINVTNTPTITITATNTDVCVGSSTTFTLSGAATYTVTNPMVVTSSTVVVSPTIATTYTINGETAGCAGKTETITITVNALPVVAAANATTCAGNPVTLSASGADNYNWLPGSVTGNTITVSPTGNTSYSVSGTNTLTGCTSTLTEVFVSVNALPTVTATANPNTTCTSGTVNLTANTSATTYTWVTGNGITAGNQNQQTITFPASGLTNGPYVYTVTVTGADGCVSLPATATLNIIDVPNAEFNLSDLSICLNSNGGLSINNPQTGTTYNWNINGQTIANVNPLTIPASVTGTAGTYTVSVIAGIGTCTNTAANTLTVMPLPVVVLINATTSACENASAQLDVANPGTGNSYVWTYNSQVVANGSGLTVSPLTNANSGNYLVTATDANGCANSATGFIDIQLCETFVPEIFTPNGDGKNDGFVIKNIENYPDNNLKIFNRWGNLVYEKNGYLNEFDGFANTGDAMGKSKLPSGTYYVILVYGDEKTETYNGYLLLQY